MELSGFLPRTDPSLFAALREQFGLKLEDAVTVLPVVVIGSIERPTPD
jgi:uncharacterized protein (TIGR03435 family)